MEAALPLLSGLLMARACPMEGSEKGIKSSPPPQVFGLVWTVLYALMGYSWYLATKKDFSWLITALYTALTILLALWVFVFGCGKMNVAALWLFMPITGVLYAIMALLFSRGKSGLVPSLLMIPLLVWIKFAYYLNFAKVEIIPRHEDE